MVLYYEESGDVSAPLIVFLHGGGVSSWMWEKQLNYFTHYHCIAVDLPEHGKSSDSSPFSIKDAAEKVVEIIESNTQRKKTIIIGFSLGAQVALEVVSINPNLADYVMINSALVRPSHVMKTLMRPAIKLTYPFIKNRTFSERQAKVLYIDDEFFDDYYKESIQLKRDTLVRVLEENLSFELSHDFKKAKARILVTVGEKENRMMKKSVQDIVSRNANCDGIIIANVGHGVPLAQPEFFNELVENWIQQDDV